MNLVFTGFMGTGKTTVGKIAAKKLGRLFFDTDSMMEDAAGLSISEIFEQSGEAVFRKMEAETVALAAEMDDIVISCGGGVVINPKNIENLRKKGIVINLFASPESLLERIRKENHRPLIAKALDPLVEIKRILRRRGEAYKNCDFAFNTENLSPEQCAEEILNDANVRRLLERGHR